MPRVANSAGSIGAEVATEPFLHRPASAAARESSSVLGASVVSRIDATRDSSDAVADDDAAAPSSAARRGGPAAAETSRVRASASAASGVRARCADPTTSESRTSKGAGVAGGGVASFTFRARGGALGSATVRGDRGARARLRPPADDAGALGFLAASTPPAPPPDLVDLSILSMSTRGVGMDHGVAPRHPAFSSGCVAISAIFGRSPGLGARHRRMSSRAPSFTTPSGNSYALALIRLYVACTSLVWNGGVPTNRV